jgi:hypothetical protein
MSTSRLIIAVLGIGIALPASAQLVRLGGNGNARSQSGVSLGQTTGQVGGTLNGAAGVNSRGAIDGVGNAAAQTTDSAQQQTVTTTQKSKKAAKHTKDKTVDAADQTATTVKSDVKAAKDSADSTSVSTASSSDSNLSVGNNSAATSQNSNVKADKSGVKASTDASGTAEHQKKD